MMTHKELNGCLTDFFKEDVERAGVCIMAEPDGDTMDVACQIHGTVIMLAEILSELMKTNTSLYAILKTAVTIVDQDKHEEEDTNS